jgi:hypothetical protein
LSNGLVFRYQLKSSLKSLDVKLREWSRLEIVYYDIKLAGTDLLSAKENSKKDQNSDVLCDKSLENEWTV